MAFGNDGKCQTKCSRKGLNIPLRDSLRIEKNEKSSCPSPCFQTAPHLNCPNQITVFLGFETLQGKMFLSSISFLKLIKFLICAKHCARCFTHTRDLTVSSQKSAIPIFQVRKFRHRKAKSLAKSH